MPVLPDKASGLVRPRPAPTHVHAKLRAHAAARRRTHDLYLSLAHLLSSFLLQRGTPLARTLMGGPKSVTTPSH